MDLVRDFDRFERTSLTDSTDLAARETVYLEFARTDGPLGLALSARNSFVSTYLLYQMMAYMGTGAGEFLAELERGNPLVKARARGLWDPIGGIEISLEREDGEWQQVGRYTETGPIASDVQLFPFEVDLQTEVIRVRLTMAKGYWRIGYASLVALGGAISPLVLDPQRVESEKGPAPQALAALTDPDRYLVTYPGDEYRIVFDLPQPDQDFEFFLESQGYYYEWMRGEWLKEEDPAMVALILTNPSEALRRMAPAFKRVEPQMERLFWASKFGR